MTRQKETGRLRCRITERVGKFRRYKNSLTYRYSEGAKSDYEQRLPKLTAQQLMFCREYVATKDLDATRAAFAAGYSKHTAYVQGSRLLRKVPIMAEIARLMEQRTKRVDVTADMVIQELRKLAFHDVRRFYDGAGRMIPINQLGDDIAPAVIGINVSPPRRRKGRQVQGCIKSIRLVNKKDTLELLGRHLGMFKDNLVIEDRRKEFQGKTADELDYFAIHGVWPERTTANAGADGTVGTAGGSEGTGTGSARG